MSLTLESLRQKIHDGDVDTVLVMFPDHLGRLLGKRVTGHFFLDYIAAGGMEACDYLLTVDIDMEPQPGFEMASWEEGYGDFAAKVDMPTLRMAPWLEATALVLADLHWLDGRDVEAAPRNILRKQVERAAKAGLRINMGSELEFYLFKERVEEFAARGFTDPKPTSDYIIDYHILGSTRDEDVIRAIRNHMDAADVPVEFSKGEWGRGQHEINLRYAEAIEMADRHVIYKNAAKEIAWLKGHCLTFMAKYDAAAAGSSCHIHTSVFDKTGKKNLLWDARAKKPSAEFEHFLGGMLKYSAEFFLFFSSTVNAYKRYQAGTFAPTNIAWSRDNRTTGFRIVGRGDSYRIENRMPGGDANVYLAFAATIAAGLAGLEEKLDCGKPYQGDAYQDPKLKRIPGSLGAAADALEKSKLAKKAFGESVVRHYVRLARLEQAAFDAAVTDWERQRYFDRI